MAENTRVAVTFVEQGQVRVGPNVVTDPAFLVTRDMEDFVTWYVILTELYLGVTSLPFIDVSPSCPRSYLLSSILSSQG